LLHLLSAYHVFYLLKGGNEDPDLRWLDFFPAEAKKRVKFAFFRGIAIIRLARLYGTSGDCFVEYYHYRFWYLTSNYREKSLLG
jgi:hypothetical protein